MMQESSPPKHCPTCQSSIPADAPGGLCPVCALKGAAVASRSSYGARTPAPSIEEIATHFPDLELIEFLGSGAMGAVYKARQPQLDRLVAIKILAHELAEDPAFVERFNREAKMLARLSHPNIVAIFDFGTAGPYCYLLMELVDGVNLRQAMDTGGFKPAEALTLVKDVCSALQFAHEEGILHRDIKPENVLIDAKGRVKIADFGIAKMLGNSASGQVTLTMQGSILGTPHYMAPEQIETPYDVDQRADIYSLGVVFYEMLTGELPLGRFALPSEKASMDARIDEIVLRTLAKEREARYQSAHEVGTHVARVASSPPRPALPPQVPAKSDSGWARFSALSLILSLVGSTLLPISGILMTDAHYREGLDGKLSLWVSGTLLVISVIAMICGWVLGLVAMADVRKSGWRKGGFAAAMTAFLLPICTVAGILIYNFIPQGPPSGFSEGPNERVRPSAMPPLFAREKDLSLSLASPDTSKSTLAWSSSPYNENFMAAMSSGLRYKLPEGSKTEFKLKWLGPLSNRPDTEQRTRLFETVTGGADETIEIMLGYWAAPGDHEMDRTRPAAAITSTGNMLGFPVEPMAAGAIWDFFSDKMTDLRKVKPGQPVSRLVGFHPQHGRLILIAEVEPQWELHADGHFRTYSDFACSFDLAEGTQTDFKLKWKQPSGADEPQVGDRVYDLATVTGQADKPCVLHLGYWADPEETNKYKFYPAAAILSENQAMPFPVMKDHKGDWRLIPIEAPDLRKSEKGRPIHILVGTHPEHGELWLVIEVRKP